MHMDALTTMPTVAAQTVPFSSKPRITVCIPHWQVRDMMSICLRSIRKHSAKYDLEVIVVDNGSRDESLDYLRSLPWIRLIERPEENVSNWPANVFTAWDVGLRACTGEYFVTMHSDVFVREEEWLDPFLAEIVDKPQVAGVGVFRVEIAEVGVAEDVEAVIDADDDDVFFGDEAAGEEGEGS